MCHKTRFRLEEDPVMGDCVSDYAPDVMLVQRNLGGKVRETYGRIEGNELG